MFCWNWWRNYFNKGNYVHRRNNSDIKKITFKTKQCQPAGEKKVVKFKSKWTVCFKNRLYLSKRSNFRPPVFFSGISEVSRDWGVLWVVNMPHIPKKLRGVILYGRQNIIYFLNFGCTTTSPWKYLIWQMEIFKENYNYYINMSNISYFIFQRYFCT